MLKLVIAILIAGIIMVGFYLGNPGIIAIGLLLVGWAYNVYKNHLRRKISKQKRFIENYRFPENLTRFISKEYSHLDENQVDEILENLRRFFMLNNEYPDKSAVVSSAVDHAWKEFSKTEPEYGKFCRSAFNKYLPYTPFIYRPLETLLRERKHQVWLWACMEDEIDPLFPDRLPRLFSLDERFNIPGGSHYFIDNGSFTHILDISFAPTPKFIVQEIEVKLSAQLSRETISRNRLYLANKIQFYINHDKWIENHFKSEVRALFKAIEDNDELLVGLFGKYALFEEESRRCNKIAESDSHNPNHPDYDPGCSCSCSSGAAR